MRSLGEASAAWNNATEKRLDAMAVILEKLLHTTSEDKSSEALAGFSKHLSTYADMARHRGNIRSILKSLHFAQIKQRQNEIPQAHHNTFQWIFDESSSSKFTSWLCHSRQGVFWVTGKPGSGKSTLMKLILSHKTTITLAEKWAGPKPLIIVSHFFWSVGNKIQQSQEGLLRTLLFQILVQCPEAIPKICNERYSDPFRSFETWSIEELSQTFKRLQRTQEFPFRILLLVDGLDEYIGEPRELTEFLNAIANSPDVKVCCSSRPWPEFCQAFGGSLWKLEMQNLTRNDIVRFVEDHLCDDATFKTLQLVQKDESLDLFNTICDRAEGVFFWVSLVVKSLLRGLRNDDNIGILHKRLAELPSDLEPFFQRMLDSIEAVYVDDAYLVFMTLLSAKTSLPEDLLKHLPEIRKHDPLKAAENKFSRFQILVAESKEPKPLASGWKFESKSYMMANNSMTKRPQSMRGDILDKCRDLIQNWRTDKFDIRIGFIHRTVFEFLMKTPSLQDFGLKIPIGPNCLFLTACLWDLEDNRPIGPSQRETFLRLCHFLQELEVDKFPSPLSTWKSLCALRGTGSHIPRLLPEIWYWLLGHAQARFLLKLDPPLPNNFMLVDCLHIVSAILKGSIHVDVAEYPKLTTSSRIDTKLLGEILDLYEESTPVTIYDVDSFWKPFLSKLSTTATGGRKPPPRNTIEACKVFVEHGASRYVQLSKPGGQEQDITEQQESNTLEQASVDAMDIIQSSGRFETEELEELRNLFPSEGLTKNSSTGFGKIWHGWRKRWLGIRHDAKSLEYSHR